MDSIPVELEKEIAPVKQEVPQEQTQKVEEQKVAKQDAPQKSPIVEPQKGKTEKVEKTEKTENKEKTPASQKQDNPQKSQPVAYPTGSEGDDPLFDMP